MDQGESNAHIYTRNYSRSSGYRHSEACEQSVLCAVDAGFGNTTLHFRGLEHGALRGRGSELGGQAAHHYLQAPAFLGEVITAATWVSAFAPRQSLRRYLFWRGADKTLLAEAETNWVYIDLKSGRPIRLPDELRVAFETVEDNSEVLRLLRK